MKSDVNFLDDENKDKIRIMAVDFDGTLCENDFPNIGKARDRVIKLVKDYKRHGWKTILWTCREGKRLDEAVEWCKIRKLKFDAVNDNLPIVIEHIGNTRKIVADVYLDDCAVPL